MSLFFRRRPSPARKGPKRNPITVPVSVMPPARQYDVCELDSGAGDPLPFDLTGFHGLAEGIRTSLREQREAEALEAAQKRMTGRGA